MLENKTLYLLIREDIDFHSIYGIYSDITKVLEDYNNLIKYSYNDKETLHIYALEENKFYKDNNFNKVE